MFYMLRVLVLFILLSGTGGTAWSQEDDPAPAGAPPLEAPVAQPVSDDTEEIASLPDEEPLHAVPSFCIDKEYVAAFLCGYTRDIEKAFLSTAVGRLLEEEPEIKELADRIKERYEKKAALLKELQNLAQDLGEEWKLEQILSNWFAEIDETKLALETMQAFIYVDEDDEGEMLVSFFISAVIADDSVALVSSKFEELVKILEESDEVEKVEPRISSNGIDVHAYSYEENELDNVWFFMDEDEIYCGFNDLGLVDKLESRLPDSLYAASNRFISGTSVITCELPVDHLIDLAMEDLTDDERADAEGMLDVLGVSNLSSLVADVSLEGLNIRQSLFLGIEEEPKGLFSLLRPLDADVAVPYVPEIAPNLLTMRASIDIEALITLIKDIVKEIESDNEEEETSVMEKELFKMVVDEGAKALNGGFVFSLSSPKPGSMVPRFAVAFGLGEQEKFDHLLSLAKKAMTGIIFEESEYKGVTFTSVKIPNNPAPLVPSYTQIDDVFYLAETPWTLKTIIGSIKDKEGASDSEDGKTELAAIPLETGALVVDTDFDAREIYRLLYDQYMPIVQVAFQAAMNQQGSKRETLLDLAELPLSDVILEHLTPGRAGAAFGPDGLYMSAVSPLGDPITTSLAAISLPFGLVAYGQGLDSELAKAERKVCKLRASKIAEALKVFRQTFGAGKRLPASLGELVSRGLIDDLDLFLVPSDDKPASIEFENEDGDVEEFDVSYKYLSNSKFKVPASDLKNSLEFAFDGAFDIETILDAQYSNERNGSKDEETKIVILYEMNKNAHGGRIIVCSDGTVFHVSERAFKKIIALK